MTQAVRRWVRAIHPLFAINVFVVVVALIVVYVIGGRANDAANRADRANHAARVTCEKLDAFVGAYDKGLIGRLIEAVRTNPTLTPVAKAERIRQYEALRLPPLGCDL